ncbi:MAG: cation diffusion facilitator family transporter [Bacteroidota bacterium]
MNNKAIRIQKVIVIITLLLTAAKFVAYGITHSNTILTDALESIVNIITSVFALYSIYIASKPRDNNHPYGHGKIEFIAAGMEGMLIVASGIIIIAKSATNFFHPTTIDHIWVGSIVIAATGIVNLIIGRYMVKKGKELNSIALEADGKHIYSDFMLSASVIIGVGILYFTKLVWLDSVIAIVISIWIIFMGARLIRQSLKGIMDEADDEILGELISTINKIRKDNWIDIHNMRMIQYGKTLHIDCHMTLPWYISLDEAHEEIDTIDKKINEMHPGELEFFIHADPCIPTSCKICCIAACKVRKEAFTHKVDWTLETLLINKKHGS